MTESNSEMGFVEPETDFAEDDIFYGDIGPTNGKIFLFLFFFRFLCFNRLQFPSVNLSVFLLQRSLRKVVFDLYNNLYITAFF